MEGGQVGGSHWQTVEVYVLQNLWEPDYQEQQSKTGVSGAKQM
jgi:hypothetical protein